MGETGDLGYRQRLVDDVRILVLGPRMQTDAEFDVHIAEAVAMAGSVRVVIVAILGNPAMSAERRAKLDRAGLVRVRTAVLTESVAIRAMLTAIRWLGGDIRPFPMQGELQACEFLAIPAGARERVARELRGMIEEVRGDAAPLHEARTGLSRAVARVEQAVSARAENIRRRAAK